jgi:hypothetical protein
MKEGDIIWQRRLPGGDCLLIQVYETKEEYAKELKERRPEAGEPIWSDLDFPILRVLHPSEGMIEDPSYYYQTMKEALEKAGYTL